MEQEVKYFERVKVGQVANLVFHDCAFLAKLIERTSEYEIYKGFGSGHNYEFCVVERTFFADYSLNAGTDEFGDEKGLKNPIEGYEAEVLTVNQESVEVARRFIQQIPNKWGENDFYYPEFDDPYNVMEDWFSPDRDTEFLEDMLEEDMSLSLVDWPGNDPFIPEEDLI